MIGDISINLRSIPAFKNLSDSAIQDIENDAQLLKYPIGQPICNKKDLIPNKILVILSGEARLLYSQGIQSSTISKLSITLDWVANAIAFLFSKKIKEAIKIELFTWCLDIKHFWPSYQCLCHNHLLPCSSSS